jgi:hypothetical protein
VRPGEVSILSVFGNLNNILVDRRSRNPIQYVDHEALLDVGVDYESGGRSKINFAARSTKLLSMLAPTSVAQLWNANPVPDSEYRSISESDRTASGDLGDTYIFEDTSLYAPDENAYSTETPSVTVTPSNTSSRANSAYFTRENEYQRKMTQKITGLVHAIKQVCQQYYRYVIRRYLQLLYCSLLGRMVMELGRKMMKICWQLLLIC